MRREVPLFLAFIFGTFFVVDNFMAGEAWSTLSENVKTWALIVIAFTYVLGVGNLARIHTQKVSRRVSGWGYSIATLIGLFGMILLGIVIPSISMTLSSFGVNVPVGWSGGTRMGSDFEWLYNSIYVPMQATMFSLLAFYIASAAFRAFRVRTLDAALLAVTAIIVVMGKVPMGSMLWEGFPDFTEWIMSNLQNAGKRAILIGAALGAMSTGFKMILGLERTYLSGD